MFKLLKNEPRVKSLVCSLLIIINGVCLCFTAQLLSYDQITGYAANGEVSFHSIRFLGWLLFCATLSNLSFTTIVLMVVSLEKGKA